MKTFTFLLAVSLPYAALAQAPRDAQSTPERTDIARSM